jgi:hypothetical protein
MGNRETREQAITYNTSGAMACERADLHFKERKEPREQTSKVEKTLGKRSVYLHTPRALFTHPLGLITHSNYQVRQ